MMHSLVPVLALVATLAAAPSPPNPFSLETPNPAATSLPEIGRVRSLAPPCTAMRDLVIPAFSAALRADKIFVETRSALTKYIDQADQGPGANPAFREMMLTRLDKQVTDMKQNLLVLNRALGDPRLSPDLQDAQVRAERSQLQQLYDTQAGRANTLSEFVIRQQYQIAKVGIDDNSALSASRRNGAGAPDAGRGATPMPGQTAPPGMPLLNGIAMSDKNAINEWTKVMAADVRQSENEAAKTFYPIARSCR